jgi:tetratricopeptide (TPR) repeat protein
LEYATKGNLAEAESEFQKAKEIYEFLDLLEPSLQIIEDVKNYKIRKEAAFYLFESIYFWKYASEAKALENAIFDLNMFVGYETKYPFTYLLRGRVSTDLGLYKQAVHDLNMALEIDPEYAEAYMARGVVNYNTNLSEEALDDFNKALQTNPMLVDAYVWRGKACIFRFNQYDRAIEDFNKALQINPESAEAYMGRAQAYYFKEEYSKSLADQKKARRLGYKGKLEKEIEETIEE